MGVGGGESALNGASFSASLITVYDRGEWRRNKESSNASRSVILKVSTGVY